MSGNKIRYILNCLLFIFFTHLNSCYSQTKIIGTVKGKNDILYSANVILKDSISKSIIAFTHSDNQGNYTLETPRKGKFTLTFTSMGFEVKHIPVFLKENEDIVEVNVQLEEKLMSLDEVIIKSDKSISVKKDTINLKTKFYIDGTEQTIEDLLKKLPGVSVEPNGTIKIGNQEIEKLMVDGDDLFEKGYKILSKNMPAYPINEVEILKNFSNNRLLKGIEESDKVALNLKLNEKSKRIWFGNTETSLGNSAYYQLKGNLMNFGKKNKYYFLTNFNNIGYDATGDINNLIYTYETSGGASVGNNQHVENLINLPAGIPNFKQSRTNFNNADLFCLNAIFNPSEKLKIKTLGFFNWDKADYFRNSIDVVDVNRANFINSQDFELQKKNRIAFGKLDLTYNISKTKMLETTLKYNDGDFNDNSNLIFNGKSTIENLQHQNKLFDHKIGYTSKFQDKKVLLITGRYINEIAPQDYGINEFFYPDLFPFFSHANNVSQQSTNQMQFAGINVHLLNRKSKGHLLEFQIGNEFRKDKLITEFSLLEDDLTLDFPNGYQNRTTYQVNDLYIKTKYRLKINNFGIVGQLDVHQLFNRLNNDNESKNENPFFINPSVALDWKIDDKNKMVFSYSYNTTNARILDSYRNYVLTGFGSFSKGTDDFNQLDTSSFIMNYQLGNWNDRVFVDTFILYNKNHDYFSTNSLINQQYSQAETILIKNQDLFNINSKIDYYFKFISSNLKINLGYIKSDFQNTINNSDLRKVKSINYSYGLEARSGFKGIFNYHIGTKWNITEIVTTINNSFTDNVSFLDLSFILNKRLNFQLQSERYYFGNLQTNKTYYFLDLDAQYKLIENKLTLGFTGKNLFDTLRFRSFSTTDIGSSTTEYRLLPRFGLLKLEYRF